VPHFISLVEDGDNSVHYVNLEQIVQMVHVPGSPLATVTTTDGRSFRVGDAEAKKLLRKMDHPGADEGT
jgi:hypothetical protein